MEQTKEFTLTDFLEKHSDYYIGNLCYEGKTLITLEVNCKKRKEFPKDEEIEDLKILGAKNIHGSDYTRCCCGEATFALGYVDIKAHNNS